MKEKTRNGAASQGAHVKATQESLPVGEPTNAPAHMRATVGDRPLGLFLPESR